MGFYELLDKKEKEVQRKEFDKYIKNIGRTLEVINLDDQIFKGNLSKANQEGITLEWKAREPKPVGKGKVTVTKTKKLAFASIKKAKVIIK